MSALFVVLPVVLIVVFGAVIAYAWAVKHGQFDDLDTPALRMLHDDDDAKPRPAEPDAGKGATRDAPGPPSGGDG
jgi:cbb3-type cytochrome oxidase maturation protein